MWDSNFDDDKRMRCLEGEEIVRELPASLGKCYSVEAMVDGSWRTLAMRNDNFRRLDLFTFTPLAVTSLRLSLLEERKAGEPARLFAFEPLDP